MYSCHFRLERQREHAEQVDVQVKSSLKIVMPGLPCKIGQCLENKLPLHTYMNFTIEYDFVDLENFSKTLINFVVNRI